MSTSLAHEDSRADAGGARRLSGRGVVCAGIGLVLVQLAFRGWAVAGAWFQVDDFAFMSRIMGKPLPEVMVEPYIGHLMPGGFLLSWVNFQLGPLVWTYPAAELLAMQAVASAGCLVLLVSAFGPRPGILPPLVIYLFSVISLPAFIWWAAGVNQLPLQIAFFWGLYTHLAYLRSRRLKYAVLTMLITLFSLFFYEKTLLLFPVFAIVALGYFAAGDIGTRLRMVWQRYRPAVVGYGVVAAGYAVFYAVWALSFSPNAVNQRPLAPVLLRLGWGFGTGILGGPLGWRHPQGPFFYAAPGSLVMVAAGLLLFAVGRELVRTCVRAKRAWLIPGFLLASDILLVVAARSGMWGATVAEDYRYQTELAGATAVALGLSLMPLLGAVESAVRKRPSAFFDMPARVTSATVAVACLAVVSSLQYALHWQGWERPREYFATVRSQLTSKDGRVPLAGGPDIAVLAFADPGADTRQMRHRFFRHARFVFVATDQLFVIDKLGRVVPAVVPPVRRAKPGQGPCGYAVQRTPVHIPLNGPVYGAGWWVRIGYLASGDSPVRVTAGTQTYRTEIRKGVHSLFFETGDKVHTIRLSGLRAGVTLCADDVTLGQPKPYVGPSG